MLPIATSQVRGCLKVKEAEWVLWHFLVEQFLYSRACMEYCSNLLIISYVGNSVVHSAFKKVFSTLGNPYLLTVGWQKVDPKVSHC